ncbi:MAG: hypothetical protein Q8L11_02895 [Candidatus Moranbacteria bacterium]|nr:hypothetical protein [Candidatus Moranbacteria bacterium]
MSKLEKYRKYVNILPVVAAAIIVAVCCKRIWLDGSSPMPSILDVVELLFAGCCCIGWFYLLEKLNPIEEEIK